jgi:hypothetical protein
VQYTSPFFYFFFTHSNLGLKEVARSGAGRQTVSAPARDPAIPGDRAGRPTPDDLRTEAGGRASVLVRRARGQTASALWRERVCALFAFFFLQAIDAGTRTGNDPTCKSNNQSRKRRQPGLVANFFFLNQRSLLGPCSRFVNADQAGAVRGHAGLQR